MSGSTLRELSEIQWRQALPFCDEAQLTLTLGGVCGDQLPPWVVQRIRANRDNNATRLEHLHSEYRQIAQRLDAAGVEHVVVKGFAQQPSFVFDLRLRPQYDLDLWCRADQVKRARDVLLDLGFKSLSEQEKFPTDHLPPLARKTGWEWKGDYFDPNIPPVIELHFRLWDEHTEGFAVEGLEAFWDRRCRQDFRGRSIPVLHPPDQFAYAALHVLRHLLRGNLKASHVYEIAYFLHQRRGDEEFWAAWRQLHPATLRRVESLSCGLAQCWFGCELPAAIHDQIEGLQPEILAWFEDFAACAIESRFHPNKDELWLHLALLTGVRRKLTVARRRLLPLTLPGPVAAVYVPRQSLRPGQRLRAALKQTSFALTRALFHTRALAAAVAQALSLQRHASARRKHPR